jgi:hypothetical protein
MLALIAASALFSQPLDPGAGLAEGAHDALIVVQSEGMVSPRRHVSLARGEYDALADVDREPENTLCVDGTTLTGIVRRGGMDESGTRHACRGHTLVDAYGSELIALAVAADPEMAAYLAGMAFDEGA